MPERKKYQIVKTHQEPADQPATHAHITAVKLDDGRILQRPVVIEQMRDVEFVTKDPQTDKEARVLSYVCAHCELMHIRSAPDATVRNNLDSLPRF